MGNQHSTHRHGSPPSSPFSSTSSPSSSPPSTPRPQRTSRIKSWSSRSSTSTTTTTTSISPSSLTTYSPSSSIADPLGLSEREFDVRPRKTFGCPRRGEGEGAVNGGIGPMPTDRPLRVGYPYYEDVLWEAEIAAREKERIRGKGKGGKKGKRSKGRR